MKYKETCKCCGNEVKLYRYTINKPLLQALAQLYKHGGMADLQKDLNLTKNQYNNFQKLQYFSLVEKTSISGVWQITKLGIDFVESKKSICFSAFTLGKANIHEDSKIVKAELKKPLQYGRVQDIKDVNYKKYLDYITNHE